MFRLPQLDFLYYLTPIVIPALCLWSFIHGVRILIKRKDRKLLAVAHIVLSVIIISLFFGFIWILVNTIF